MASITVLMNCAHTRMFSTKGRKPATGEQIYCFQCGKESLIIASVKGWLASCKDCIYRKETGASESNANRAATLHMRRYPSHTVQLLFDNEVRRTRMVEAVELPMYADDDHDGLGLLEASRAAQAILRSNNVMQT
jgi:hypothetical protein